MSNLAANMPRSGSKQRIVSVQVCRGLASMMVVLAHLHYVERKYFTTNFMGTFQYGVLGVDLFFVISGVVISAVTCGKFQSSRNAMRFLYHRLARIYPIYWFYSAVVLAAFLYNPMWVNASGGHQVNIVQSFLLIPSSLPMLLLQGWTLTYELYFYLVFFALLLFCPERYALKMLAVWAGIVIALNLLHILPHWALLSVFTSPAILEFVAGCAIFHLYRRASLHPQAGIALIVASLLWLACTIFWTASRHGSNEPWIEDSPWRRVFFYGIFAVLFLFGLMELERSSTIASAQSLEKVGDWSYSIYLSHTIVLKFYCHFIALWAAQSPFAILTVTVLSIPTVLFVGYLSFNYLERPLIFLFSKPKTAPAVLQSA